MPTGVRLLVAGVIVAAAIGTPSDIEYCDEDPKTKCGLSGIPHVHPEDPNHPGAYGPCPVHPGRPGDH